MYCVKCGVKLADTEQKCPLCNTVVYHPDIKQEPTTPLYPSDKMPINTFSRKGICGMIVILFLIPLVISLYSDLQLDNKIDWSGYVAGALIVSYIIVALPLWFKKPNPVIFVPCSFASIILYLLYINIATNGNWFLSFALPVGGGLCLIISAIVTLTYYLKKGKLYIFGGALMLFGALICMIEVLLNVTFDIKLIGWSIYPLIVLFLLGGVLIYLGINSSVRKILERKLFF